jgi:hypothetical protein
LARKYWDGSVTNTPMSLAIQSLNPSTHEVRFNALRGLYYKLQSKTDINAPFTDDGGGPIQAMDGSIARTNDFSGTQKFYRAVCLPVP